MKLITGFFMAWGNFCAIPCPCKLWDEKARKLMLLMFPVIGMLIGALWYALYWLINLAAIPVPVAAALLTAYPFAASGFIHLDGFMDCNDAILSRRPLQERQKILKDSHVGAFAVITAILLFMLFFASIWAMLERQENLPVWILIFIPVLSRAMSARTVLSKRPLSTSQYQTFQKEQNRIYIWVATGTWTAAALLMAVGSLIWNGGTHSLIGWVGAITAAVQLIGSLLSGNYGRKQLGGMSGDIAGYMLVWSELAAVFSLAVC